MRLHTNREVILPETFRLLKQLQSAPRQSEFFLVGGTALALQIGHRLSIDLDLFSKKSFETPLIIDHLIKNHRFNLSEQSKNTVLGFIDSIKVDFITHAYPLINPLIELNDLRLAL